MFIYKNNISNVMKLFRILWNNTIFYSIYDFYLTAKEYHYDKKYVYDTLHSDGFKKVIDHYLNTNLRYNKFTDEPYCIVNPNTKADGSLDTDAIIMEIDGNNTNTDMYVQNWILKRMSLVEQLFKVGELYKYINIINEHVGPEMFDNYLIRFQIASKNEYDKSLYRLLLHLIIDSVIVGGLLFLI